MSQLRRDPAGRTCPDCAVDLGETIPLDESGTCHGCGSNFGKSIGLLHNGMPQFIKKVYAALGEDKKETA